MFCGKEKITNPKSLVFALLIGMYASSLLADSWFAFSAADKNLLCAHRQYVRENYEKMLLCLKKTLEDLPEDGMEKENALERHPDDDFGNRNALNLLEKAFADYGKKGIALDWHLPKEISVLLVNERRLELENGPTFQLQAAGYSQYGSIRQLKITKVPG